MQTLPRMAEALCRIDFPQDRWKIVAVDNNSTDGTGEFLRSLREALPIEVHLETRQGKSFAMNRGLDHIEGDLAVLTDDDVIPERDWLMRLWEISLEKRDYDVFAGTIRPDWPRPPDRWILDWVPFGSTFAINQTTQSGPVDASHAWGPNTAIRSKVIRGGCRFDEAIGPDGTEVFAMGEDVAFARRAAAGKPAYFCAEAQVSHIIREEQLSEDWIVERARRFGSGVNAVFPQTLPGGPGIAGVPLSLWARRFGFAVLAPLLKPCPRSKYRFRALWKDHYYRGLVGALRKRDRSSVMLPRQSPVLRKAEDAGADHAGKRPQAFRRGSAAAKPQAPDDG